MGQRIHVFLLSFRKSFLAPTRTFYAASSAPGEGIPSVADFNAAVKKHVRMFADILEGFQAEKLSLVVRLLVELQGFIHCAPENKTLIGCPCF